METAKFLFTASCMLMMGRALTPKRVSKWSLQASFYSGRPVLQKNSISAPLDVVAPVIASLDFLNICGRVRQLGHVDADRDPIEELGRNGCTDDTEFPPFGINRNEWWASMQGRFKINGPNALALRFTLQANRPHQLKIDNKTIIDNLDMEAVRRTESVRLILPPGLHTIGVTYICHLPTKVPI